MRARLFLLALLTGCPMAHSYSAPELREPMTVEIDAKLPESTKAYAVEAIEAWNTAVGLSVFTWRETDCDEQRADVRITFDRPETRGGIETVATDRGWAIYTTPALIYAPNPHMHELGLVLGLPLEGPEATFSIMHLGLAPYCCIQPRHVAAVRAWMGVVDVNDGGVL